MSNGVMAALQILVLSVQVRVLVGQQKTPHGMPCGAFFSVALAVGAPSAQGGTDTVGSIYRRHLSLLFPIVLRSFSLSTRENNRKTIKERGKRERLLMVELRYNRLVYPSFWAFAGTLG